VRAEVDTIDTAAVLDRMTGKGQYHARVATELWKDNWLFGCGGWGYIHYSIPKMTDEERKQMQMVGGINVHNDYLQFLAEHGAVGFGAIVAVVVMLLAPAVRTWRILVKTARFSKAKNRPPSPVQIFAMPASVFYILAAAAATCIHSFGDCPMRSAAVMSLFFVMLAATEGFLPKIDSSKEN
jgi:O-antigen ligase